MEKYEYLLHLAIILFATKALGLIMRRLGLPQVVGALLAGLFIGPIFVSLFGQVTGLNFLIIKNSADLLKKLSEIGVIMIIFSAGLETDLKEIKKTGVSSLLVACGGVLIPLICGFLIAAVFNGGFHFTKDKFYHDLFIGVILTATSISISVQTLKEMGKLKSKAGNIILSAAIIDDILGIVIVSLVLGLNGAGNPVISIIKLIAFFVVSIGIGFGLHLLFKYLSKKHPRQRRVPIFAFCVCLFYAYIAEKVFGVADITGAYIAGVTFSGITVSEYIEKKIDINSYMIFAPVFFAFIGIKASFDGFQLSMLGFALAFVVVGIISKIIGCYGVSRLLKNDRRESLAIGFGMIARGEVALVVMDKGMEVGLIGNSAGIQGINIAVILLVVISSVLAPILLKMSFKKDKLPQTTIEG